MRTRNSKKLSFFDFCSGIGAGRLGLERAGMFCVGRSDTSRLSDTTYQILHDCSNDKNYGNLKRIKTEAIPDFDILIAGFPCQTFSVMGRRAGFDDDRGQIIFHLARIIAEKKPKAFILENVRGLVSHDKGKTIDIIVKELEKTGYDVRYKVLNSLDYGVPQMRWRVYFVGLRKDLDKNIDSFEFPKEVKKPSLFDGYLVDDKEIESENLERLPYYLKNPTNNGEYTIDDLIKMDRKLFDTRMSDLRIYDDKCPTLRSQRDGIYYSHNGKLYQLTGYEALLLQGFPKEMADKVKDSVTDRHLLMQAGNAMTVNVIEKLGKQIKKILEAK